MTRLRKTKPVIHLAVIRAISSLPLLIIGTLHLIGQAPLMPILEGAEIPFPTFFAAIVPILQVAAGLSLLIGFYSRLGAVTALVIMAVAMYAHMMHDWADEPTIVLPIAVFVGVLQILWGGAGVFSSDIAAS
ncbi:MAG: DoxX family protein [Acidobacteriota bacterium]